MKNIKTFFSVFIAILSVNTTSEITNLLSKSSSGDVNVLGCVNPLYPKLNLKFNSNQINASRMDVTSNGAVSLKDEVTITINGGRIKASSAHYDPNSGSISAIQEGNIYYLDSYFEFLSGSFNRNSKEVRLEKGSTYLRPRNILIQYESLEGTMDSYLHFKNTSLTTCADIENGWEIKADSISIDDISKRGHIENLKLQVRGKAILSLPYLPFPATNDRLTGLLEPNIGITSDGADIYLPYFWVLSEKSDITIAPRLIGDKGAGIEANFRYVTNTKAENYVDFIFFPHDKEFKKQYGQTDDQRWAYKIKDFRKYKNINFYVNWSKSSDSMVLLDLPSDLVNIANQRDHYLPQTIFIAAEFGNLGIDISKQGYQSLNPFIKNGYIKNPEINLNYSRYNPRLSYFANIEYTDFKIDKPIKSSTFTNGGTRMISKIGVEANNAIGPMDVEFNGHIISKKYNLDGIANKSFSKNIPTASLSISSTFKQLSPLGGFIATPKIIYSKTSYKNQSSDPIFDLHPRDGSNLNIFNQRLFYGKDRIPDQEFIMGSLRWQGYFTNQNTVLFELYKINEIKNSKILNEMLLKDLSRDNQAGFELRFDNELINTFLMTNYSQKKDHINFGNMGLSINLPETQISTSRKFRRYVPLIGTENELDYIDLSINHNLSQGYKFIGGISKDLKSKKNLETFFGIEFENCCIAYRIFISDKRLSKYNLADYITTIDNNLIWEDMISIENKSKITFEFELKGLSGSRKQINKFFSNAFVNL